MPRAAVLTHARRWVDDVRAGLRDLRRAPAYAVGITALLAAGFALTAVLTAVMDSMLWRPLRLADADALVVAWKRIPGGFDHHPFLRHEIDQIGRESRLFAAVAGIGTGSPHVWTLERGEAIDEIAGALVTGAYFAVVGAQAQRGRPLQAADDLEGAAPVLVLSHDFWRRAFGARDDVIGEAITVDQQRFTVVGVMPAGVEYPHDIDVWRPLATVKTSAPFGAYVRRNVDLVARLAPNVSREEAAAELAVVLTGLEADAPTEMPRGMQPVVQAYRHALVGDARMPIVLLFATTTLVLIVACANVAGLSLVRAQRRRRDRAIRSALGASRARLLVPALAETVCLTVMAAAIGLLVAWAILPAVLSLIPDRLPLTGTVVIDARVVGLTALLAAVSAAVSGLVPAMAQAPVDVAHALRQRGYLASGPRRATQAAVVVQAAVAVLVIVTAGWLLRSADALDRVDPGVPYQRLTLARLALPHALSSEPRALRQRLDALTDRLSAVPGVVAVTALNNPPFSGTGWDVPRFAAEGQTPLQADANPPLALEAVHPQHFDALGIPFVSGRSFTDADTATTPAVAVVSRSVATRAWPGQDPLGRRLRMGGPMSTEPWRTVIGVVEDVHYRDVHRTHPTLYLPSTQLVESAQSLVIQTTAAHAPPGGAALLAAARSVDAGIGVREVVSFDDLRARPLRRPIFQAQVVTAFAAAGLLLAAVGLYVVVAGTVRQRLPEFGIRVAVGASPGSLRRLVTREGVALALVGAVLGGTAALLLRPAIEPLLFGVPSVDLVVLSGAVTLVVAAAVLACARPAGRAATVDPASLLRSE